MAVSETPVGWFHRAEQGLADRFAQRQLRSVAARAQITARPPLTSRVLMWVVVAPVHLVLVASLVLGVYLAALGSTMPWRVLGVVLLLVAYATSPRPTKLPRHSVSIQQEDAPLLFALVRDVAAVCAAPVPARILLTRDFEAFASRVGWRRTPIIGLGAPLWVAAPPQARVALLGHELGHFAHGDLTDGWWVWGAQSSLAHWLDICGGPRAFVQPRTSFIVNYALVPFRMLVLSYLWVIQKVNGASSQRREYFADLDGARSAGTAGAVRMLEVLFLEHAVTTAMTRAAVSRARPDMWRLVKDEIERFGDEDFRRRRLGADAEQSRIDASHPATLLRLRLLDGLSPLPASVTLDAGLAGRIDTELAGALAIAALHAGDHIRYQR